MNDSFGGIMGNLWQSFLKKAKIFSWILFIIYLILLNYLLFFSPTYGRDGVLYNYNLIPFKTIKNFIIYREYVTAKDLYINLLGNIIAFMPMGFFVPILFRNKRSLIKVPLVSGFISLSVETLQYELYVGNFDIDDIILNTIGGFLGYMVFSILYTTIGKQKRNAQRKGNR